MYRGQPSQGDLEKCHKQKEIMALSDLATSLCRGSLIRYRFPWVERYYDRINSNTDSYLSVWMSERIARTLEDIRRVQVRLSKPEQQQLDKLLRGGLQPVRTVLRALVLRQLADGQAIRKVARNVGLTAKTVWLTSQRYQQGGLERALYEGTRPGKEARLDVQQRQRIVTLVCSPPPAGRARWTVRLLAEEAVKRKLVPRVGRETVRILLESHDLKPWREKNVVRGRTR
jgi:putative transposase